MLRILILDRDPMTRANVEVVVRGLGHEAVAADSAGAVFRALAWNNVHAVVIAASSMDVEVATLQRRIARRWPGVACALLAANDDPVVAIRTALGRIRTDYSARTTRPLRATP